jgi:hypothetical protein
MPTPLRRVVACTDFKTFCQRYELVSNVIPLLVVLGLFLGFLGLLKKRR